MFPCLTSPLFVLHSQKNCIHMLAIFFGQCQLFKRPAKFLSLNLPGNLLKNQINFAPSIATCFRLGHKPQKSVLISLFWLGTWLLLKTDVCNHLCTPLAFLTTFGSWRYWLTISLRELRHSRLLAELLKPISKCQSTSFQALTWQARVRYKRIICSQNANIARSKDQPL